MELKSFSNRPYIEGHDTGMPQVHFVIMGMFVPFLFELARNSIYMSMKAGISVPEV
jgi:hypothetical protein